MRTAPKILLGLATVLLISLVGCLLREQTTEHSSQTSPPRKANHPNQPTPSQPTPPPSSQPPSPSQITAPPIQAELSAHDTAHEEIADLLSAIGPLDTPEKRAQVTAQIKTIEVQKRKAIEAKAKALGIPLVQTRSDGSRILLDHFQGNRPIYIENHNANAAISTNAHLVRQTSPFNVDGSGILIGMWEVFLGRPSHQEFGNPSRYSPIDGSGTDDHATHVAGTLIAQGISSSRKGMAPAASLLAYNTSNDISEMTAIGAASPNDTNKIVISNHSYGIISGWDSVDNVFWGTFINDSTNTNDYDSDFGRYSSDARSIDAIVSSLPYYLPFYSAGNHRNDGPPFSGETWTHNGFGGTSYTYNSATHPRGDGQYKNGYDSIAGEQTSKNILTIGATNDAVSSGNRNLNNATLSSFSSTGPTDDGRIKPDLVANGVSLSSSSGASNTSYINFSGTSMSSPNATGSAALLVDYYKNRFPGQAMRASTLKALLIHTADDLEDTGPDYRTGWGQINTLAAANLISAHAEYPDGLIRENSITTSQTSQTFNISAAGDEPLKVTICWTDPAGPSQFGHDSRSQNLLNDLNLRIDGPGGTFYPWIMPYVGNWTTSTIDDPATTGINTVDNVEQVLIPNPTAGNYTVTVDFAGSLFGGSQVFSTIFSGLSTNDLVITPPSSLNPSGPQGGPFNIEQFTFTLTNVSDNQTLAWTASEDVNWLEIEPTSGSLAPGGAATVSIDLNSTTSVLPDNLYQANLTFRDITSGIDSIYSINLRILPNGTLPIIENFENELPDYWSISGTNNARTLVTGSYGPNNGTRHLQMDASPTGLSSNTLTLSANLTNSSNVSLSFWARESSDELHPAPTSPYTGSANFDGLAISPDGTTWYPVFTFPSFFSSYTQFTIDLDQQLTTYGIQYTDSFQICFSHYDDFSYPNDAIFIDDISLTGDQLTPIEQWRLTHFGITEATGNAANDADPNNDGITNLLAFALGLSPFERTSNPLTLQLKDDEFRLSYSRSLDALASGLTFQIEYSDNLQDPWSTLDVNESVLGTTNGLQSVLTTLPPGSSGKRFARLVVTDPLSNN
ncbi:MAG: S8 family serine peptidase [Verrucomicrobiota bacterium]